MTDLEQSIREDLEFLRTDALMWIAPLATRREALQALKRIEAALSRESGVDET